MPTPHTKRVVPDQPPSTAPRVNSGEDLREAETDDGDVVISHTLGRVPQVIHLHAAGQVDINVWSQGAVNVGLDGAPLVNYCARYDGAVASSDTVNPVHIERVVDGDGFTAVVASATRSTFTLTYARLNLGIPIRVRWIAIG